MGLVYSKYKIFNFKEKVDSLQRENPMIMPPIHIRIKPTNVCNHNCNYCAYRAENLQLGKDMRINDYISKEKIVEIIDDIVEMGVKAVTFSGGGEPFCYPFFAEVLKKFSQTPVKFASLTNGSNLNGETAEIFAHSGTWLRVSMDGWDDKSYTHYRRVKHGEFSKIINNMKSFKKLGGKCYLGVSCIVDKGNANHIYNLIKLLRDTGVNSVKISPCIVSNDGNENNDYHDPIFNMVKDITSRAMVDFVDKDFEIYDSYHTLDNKFNKNYSWCPYLQILPVIGADLHIYPCQDKAYNIDEGLIGSIKDKRFKEFWFSDKNNFFKINPSKVCNHHCVANEKNKMILEYLNASKEHSVFV